MQMRKVALSVVVLAALGTAAAKWPHPPKAVETKPLRTAPVRRESFDVTLRVPGVLEAAKAEPIVPAVQQTQISWIAEEGTLVKPGDIIVKLNASHVTKQLTEQERQTADAAQQERTAGEDAQRRVQNAKVALEKTQRDLVLTQSQGTASVERATAQLHFSEEELKRAQSEHARKQRLADEHLLPLSQLESSADQLRSQQFQLETAQRDLAKATREAEVNEQVKKLDLRKAELEVQSAEAAQRQAQAEATRAQADRQLQLEDVQKQVAGAEIRAKSAGMLLLEMYYGGGEGHKYRAGDQANEGQKIGRIIDPGNMRVTSDVGESDIAQVRLGQPGLVRVEAIGNTVLPGEVMAVANISRERQFWEGGTTKRIFSVKLQLKDNDARLRPGMSASVEIVLARAKAELSVPAEAVFREGNKEVVYRARGRAFEAVPVTVLRRSEMTAAVKGSLREGDQVARQRPAAAQLVGAKERRR